MSKKIEINLHPREAEMLIAHLAGQGHYPEVALKVADQCVEQLSYPDSTPDDWANDVRNLAYLRAENGVDVYVRPRNWQDHMANLAKEQDNAK